MNLATFMISATLAMTTAPNAFADPVFYDNRAAFNAAAGSGLSFESFENPPFPTRGRDEISFNTLPPFTFTVTNNVPFQTDPVQLNDPGPAVTEGTAGLFYVYAFPMASAGPNNGIFQFPFPILAFGIDFTTRDNTASEVMVLGGNSPGMTSFSTFAGSPRFVGVVDPDGISSVTFIPGPTGISFPLGFDSLSFGPPITTTTTTTQTEGTTSSSTSEYIVYMCKYTDTFIGIVCICI